MILYFEDGPLYETKVFYDVYIDASDGFSSCRRRFENVSKTYEKNVRVYTNSLYGFSNYFCWDEEKKMPMIYIRDKEGKWINICDTCYGREIRYAHNLEKMYLNGCFDERR